MGTIILVTGTPGVGKSRLARELSRKGGYRLVDLSHLVKMERLYVRFDRKRGSYVIDEGRLGARLEMISKSSERMVIASHMVGRFLPKDRVTRALVLRLDPVVLYKRLRARGWNRRKAWENAEAEILDISLQESLTLLGRRRVREIDTTKKRPSQVYKEAEIALTKQGPGMVAWVNWLARYDPVKLEREL